MAWLAKGLFTFLLSLFNSSWPTRKVNASFPALRERIEREQETAACYLLHFENGWLGGE